MSINFSQLSVCMAIVHEIPKRHVHDAVGQPILSDAPSELDADSKTFFRERINDGRANAFEVEFIYPPKAVAGFILSYLVYREQNRGNGLDVEAELVSFSQNLATELHQTQTGVNSEGLLVVIDVQISRKPGVAILKLEKLEGARGQRVQNAGKSTYSIQHIRELLLHSKMKVFKVGLFGLDGTDLAHCPGLVSDQQTKTKDRPRFFFLETYLGGC